MFVENKITVVKIPMLLFMDLYFKKIPEEVIVFRDTLYNESTFSYIFSHVNS